MAKEVKEKEYKLITDGQLVNCEVLAERRFLGFLWKQSLVLYRVRVYEDGIELYTKNNVEWVRNGRIITNN